MASLATLIMVVISRTRKTNKKRHGGQCNWEHTEELRVGRWESNKGNQLHLCSFMVPRDHYDMQSAQTIEDNCIVHTFKNYTNLKNVGAKYYFCKFE
ncbi:chromatin remodeling EBS-like [Olea europaea subsp. europaea]|uniref:Chromatin remodeling EBS-like n=1 Tax=Olea europaea subsp. europaea TaxID=158383 RepID=A0A8S0SFY7_OLEEU|nr:chromatin remodeling EBS-like [Olea europaea subsp. europaea]